MRFIEIMPKMATVLAVFATSVAANAAEQDVSAKVNELLSGRGTVQAIAETPMANVYEVDLGGQTIYATATGKHLMIGDVYDMDRKVSLAQEAKEKRAKGIVDGFKAEELITYAADDKKRTVTVFTDVDCGYCRKLHKEVPELVKNGLEVRYAWYPRAGIGSDSHKKADSVWCADDQLAAMDDAKLRNKIDEKSCENTPIASQYEAGKRLGVTGTPTLVMDDGTIIGGYVPADRLLASLGLNAPKAAE